jgi:hypothetical protein
LVAKLIFSVSPICPSLPLAEKLCKPWQQELRFFYWNQAWQAIEQHPWIGYGPGTFSLVSAKYRQVIYMQTAFAHNAVLQLAAEVGIPAALAFVVGVAGWLWQGRRWLSPLGRDQVPTLGLAAMIGLVTMLVNIQFDVDWSFAGIFLSSLFVLAFVARSHHPVVAKDSPRLWQYLYFGWHALSLGILCLYLITTWLVLQGRAEIVTRWFPYFKWQLPDIKQKLLSPEQLTQLSSVYAGHPDWQYFLASTSTDSAMRATATEKLIELNPWSRLYVDPVSYYVDQGDSERVEAQWRAMDVFLTTKRDSYGFYKESIEYQRKAELAQQAMLLARQYLKKQQGEVAAYFWLKAYYYDEWAFAQRDEATWQFIVNLPDQERTLFLTKLLSVPSEFFGDNRPGLAKIYAQACELHNQSSDSTSVANQFQERSWQLDETVANSYF